jgi:hypothetical protein
VCGCAALLHLVYQTVLAPGHVQNCVKTRQRANGQQLIRSSDLLQLLSVDEVRRCIGEPPEI